VLASWLQRLCQLTCLDAGILQGPPEHSIGPFQQSQQQVFDEDLAATAHDAALGRVFKVAFGLGIQCLDELL
jgi:hypothetical protein